MKKLNILLTLLFLLGLLSAGTALGATATPVSCWTWGYNLKGQLGDGTVADKYSPTPVESVSGWAAVSAGDLHTLALKTDGTLWAWGYNLFGQLGDGTTVNKYSPTQVGEDNGWAAVSAGNTHSLALKVDGTLWAWGSNTYGELGDGTTINKYSPIPIGDETWKSVVAANGYSLAIREDGTLWAWGYNTYGQLGDGTTVHKYSPTQVGTDTDWAIVSADSNGIHTVALKTNGTLWAWGGNFYGELGDGTDVSKYSPTKIGSDNTWEDIVAGAVHTLALKVDGTLWAWGYNTYGQLGDGTDVSKYSPIQVGTANDWESLSAGAYHSLALKSDGSLYTWGLNAYGQLGDGTTTNRTTPTQVGAGYIWQAISGGYMHTVALAEPEPEITISSVSTISDIYVDNGTALADAGLPATVDVTLSDATNTTLDVTWDGGTPAYDGNTAGTCVFTGTLTLTSGITNPDNLTASVNVIVAAAPALTVSSVSAIADINVDHGTALADAGLPATVDVTLSDATNTTLDVTWDGGTPAYDGNTAGTCVFTGTLTLTSGITNPDNLTASVNIIVAAAQALTVSSVSTIADINVDHGTAQEDAGLPATVDVTLSDATNTTLDVTWDGGTPAYDGNIAGTYVFTGTLTLTSGITNPDNLTASVNVIVAAAPEITVSSVSSIADINVDNGTALADAGLPATANVTLSDATNTTLDVTWDGGTPAYDSNIAGTYVFTGTLTLTSGITNPDNLTASVDVIVAAPPVVTYNVSVSANLPEAGRVSGSGDYLQDTTVTVSAKANKGYIFVNWTEGGTEVSTSAKYTFTVSSNRTLVANFLIIPQPITYNVSVSANPPKAGRVSGSGDYLSDTTITVSAKANKGYIFVNWTEDGIEVSTSARYTFTVSSNRTLVANFVPVI